MNYTLAANRAARDAADAWLAANPDRSPAEGAMLPQVQRTFEVNWFSDGGICANLPVHFFDAPLPTRPTFAIDLEPFPPDRPKSDDESENSFPPISNRDGLLRPWTTLPTNGIGALGAFLYQMVNTARSWVDAAQLVMPGYRDRVVTIYHDDREGGMNLAMPQPVVESLAKRGEKAGAKLVDKFTGAPAGHERGWGWANQRWIRFRTATAGLDAWTTRFAATYRADAPGTVRYSDMAGAGADTPLPSYSFVSRADRTAVNDYMVDLVKVAGDAPSVALSRKAPQPCPRLRLVPDDETADGPEAETDPASIDSA